MDCNDQWCHWLTHTHFLWRKALFWAWQVPGMSPHAEGLLSARLWLHYQCRVTFKVFLWRFSAISTCRSQWVWWGWYGVVLTHLVLVGIIGDAGVVYEADQSTMCGVRERPCYSDGQPLEGCTSSCWKWSCFLWPCHCRHCGKTGWPRDPICAGLLFSLPFFSDFCCLCLKMRFVGTSSGPVHFE